MKFKRGRMNRQKLAFRWPGLVVEVLVWLFAASTAIAQADWKAEWDKTLKAARNEGRLAIAHGGGANAAMQRVFKEEVEKEFPGVRVDLIVGGGRNIAPRVLAERGAGKYAWDIYIGGTTTALALLIPGGVLDPIQPAFIDPEVTDPGKWFGGALDFADDAGKFNLALGGNVQPPMAFNTQMVKGDDIRSFWDLLDPKWRGKILMFDPRAPGVGLATATFAYVQPSLGKNFLQRLFAEQNVALTRDYRQLLEEVARGNYPVGMGVHPSIFKELASKGLPLGQIAADKIKEGSYLTTATASLGLVNKAPHPNAAKVFINWYLSREGQIAFRMANNTQEDDTTTSMREDLPANVVPEAARRRKDVDYIEISRHDWMEWKPVGDLINAARQKSGK